MGKNKNGQNWTKFINFDGTEIEKDKFNKHKGPISIGNIDINKAVLSNEICFGKTNFKYFIDHKDAQKS